MVSMQDLVGAFFDAADTRRCFYFSVVADSRGLSRLDIEPCAGCSWARRLASHTTRWAARCWHVGVVGGRRGGPAVAVAVDRASAMADAARANHRPVRVPLWGAVGFDPRVSLDASLFLCIIAHCIHGFSALLSRWGTYRGVCSVSGPRGMLQGDHCSICLKALIMHALICGSIAGDLFDVVSYLDGRGFAFRVSRELAI